MHTTFMCTIPICAAATHVCRAGAPAASLDGRAQRAQRLMRKELDVLVEHQRLQLAPRPGKRVGPAQERHRDLTPRSGRVGRSDAIFVVGRSPPPVFHCEVKAAGDDPATAAAAWPQEFGPGREQGCLQSHVGCMAKAEGHSRV